MYDLAVHFLGKQEIPNLLGLRTIEAKRHLLAASSDTKDVFDKLKDLESQKNIEVLVLDDPFGITAVKTELKEKINKINPASLAVNMTGGTKPMSFAGWQTAESIVPDADFYYFDSQNNRRFFWNRNGSKEEPISKPDKPVLKIDDFIRLSPYGIQEDGIDEVKLKARKNLTVRMWEYNEAIFQGNVFFNGIRNKQKFQNILNDYAQKIGGRNQFDADSINFEIKSVYDYKNTHKTISLQVEKGKVTAISFNGTSFGIGNDPDIADLGYFAGRWFEDLVYWKLFPLKEAGKLSEIQIGQKAMVDDSPTDPAQEFDILATDGLKLYILECKTGEFRQDAHQKLENITTKFGGAHGMGVVVMARDCYLRHSEGAAERVEKSNYACIHGYKGVNMIAEQLLDLRPGDIFPELRT